MVVESVDEVGVEASLDDPRELQTPDELRRLLVAHDLSGLQWTDRVVVESRAVPHSHPVLTLNTRHTGDNLLTTFLHEQLHWWGAAHPYWPDAVEATRPSWPSVPESVEGGAKDERSTREHLLLCSLEHRALRAVVGEVRAAVTLKRQMADVVYPWVYTQVAACGAALDDICEIHGLWPTRLIAP